MKYIVQAALVASLLVCSAAAQAADSYVITEKDKQFSPQELTIPAGQKVKITIQNQDATPAEFESGDFDREKVIGANSSVSVFIGPIDAGKYTYFDDFHRDTQGTIIAK